MVQGFPPTTLYSPSARKAKAETWSQELGPRQWETDTRWLVLHNLLTLLSFTVQDYLPRGGNAKVIWVLMHQSTIKKMPHRLECTPVWPRNLTCPRAYECPHGACRAWGTPKQLRRNLFTQHWQMAATEPGRWHSPFRWASPASTSCSLEAV